VVVGLVLFGADYLIQAYRERFQSVKLPMVLFCVGAIFSGVSNFNYLYTNFMKNDVIADTLRTQFVVFRNDVTDTRTQLLNLRAVLDEREKRNQIDVELENMWEQGTDPLRPGCAERCRGHIDTINAKLASSITDLKIPRQNDLDGFKVFYETYKRLVYETLDKSPTAATYVNVRLLQDRIRHELDRYSSPEHAMEQGKGLEVLAELSKASLDIEREANTILETGTIKHRYIDPSLGRLGEIVYSLENGFVQQPNLGATLLSAILSIAVDILPVIFALIAFRPGIMTGRESFTDMGQDDFDRPSHLL